MYFLNINKPKGITSFDVIKQLRKKLGVKSIGHSGTLDPLASGVMQIGVGACTKLLDYLLSDKTYIADINFGYVTDTFDNEGEKVFIAKPDFSHEQLNDVLNSFLGKTMQIPPKYSAIKINGSRACDLIRKNSELKVSVKPREIEIYSIDLLEYTSNSAKIKVHAKKGTYIRSLAFDIGKKLGCGAYITELLRVKAGNFDINDSQDLDSNVFNLINPLDVLPFDKYELNDEQYNKIKHGNFIQTDLNFNTEYILLTKNNKLVSLGYLSDNCGIGLLNTIKPKKNFI